MLGLGISNAPLIFQFLKAGASVTARDRRTREQLGALAGELEAAGAKLRLGDDYLEGLDEDMIFRTPGMKFHLPQLEDARRRGCAVTSEMEIFFDLCPCRIVAVTGSDGKTTTTTILSEMLKKQGCTVHLGGNIGRPLLPDIAAVKPTDVAVVELSSFQLISMRRGPDVAVVTNVTPNHLDMHKDMAEYINAKRNIVLHQNAFGRAVLNLENDVTRAFMDDVRGECLAFSSKRRPSRGSFLEDGILLFSDGMKVYDVVRADEIVIPGLHNVENYLAAIAALWDTVSIENMRAVARTFSGVEHRCELVRELDGVRWYNDSIATTPTRTAAGLSTFPDGRVVLLAGGSDKHIPFDAMGPAVVGKVKTLILMGKTADKIEETIRHTPGYGPGKPEIVHAASLEDAVKAARAAAVPGDVISLSPACASFDWFKNFEQRGERFKELVGAL